MPPQSKALARSKAVDFILSIMDSSALLDSKSKRGRDRCRPVAPACRWIDGQLRCLNRPVESLSAVRHQRIVELHGAEHVRQGRHRFPCRHGGREVRRGLNEVAPAELAREQQLELLSVRDASAWNECEPGPPGELCGDDLTGVHHQRQWILRPAGVATPTNETLSRVGRAVSVTFVPVP